MILSASSIATIFKGWKLSWFLRFLAIQKFSSKEVPVLNGSSYIRICVTSSTMKRFQDILQPQKFSLQSFAICITDKSCYSMGPDLREAGLDAHDDQTHFSS